MARTLGRMALDAIDLPGRMREMQFEAKSLASAMGLPRPVHLAHQDSARVGHALAARQRLDGRGLPHEGADGAARPLL